MHTMGMSAPSLHRESTDSLIKYENHFQKMQKDVGMAVPNHTNQIYGWQYAGNTEDYTRNPISTSFFSFCYPHQAVSSNLLTKLRYQFYSKKMMQGWGYLCSPLRCLHTAIHKRSPKARNFCQASEMAGLTVKGMIRLQYPKRSDCFQGQRQSKKTVTSLLSTGVSLQPSLSIQPSLRHAD